MNDSDEPIVLASGVTKGGLRYNVEADLDPEHDDIDLDAIRERRAKAERWHEGVHYGLNLFAASSDDVPVLLAELEAARQRIADLEAAKQRMTDMHNRLAKQWIYERDKAEAELERALILNNSPGATHCAVVAKEAGIPTFRFRR